MKISIGALIIVVSLTLVQPSYADSYAPDDTYLVCGNVLVAIETTLEQSIKNRFQSSSDQDRHGAEIMVDLEILNEGAIAEYPDAGTEGQATKNEYWLGTFGSWYYRIDRLSGNLIYKRLSGEFKVGPECEKTTHRTQKSMVDKHNEGLGGLKF
jgi:hypothetical protein